MYWIYFLLCLSVLFQDFIGIFLFFIGVPKIILQPLLAMKDMLILLIACLGSVRCVIKGKTLQINPTVCFFAGYLVVIIIYAFHFSGSSDKANNINDLRSLIFPIYAYMAGYTSYYLASDRLVKTIEKVALFSVLLSLGMYIFGYHLLIKLDVMAYTEDIRGRYGLIFKGLPSTYFTDLGRMIIFRLSGPVLNPNGTSVLFSFIFAVSLAYYKFIDKGYARKVLLILLALTIFLTFSRGAILGLILGLLVTDMIWLKGKKPLYTIYLLMAALLIIFYDQYFYIFQSTFSLRDPSSRTHYGALIASWDYLKYNWLGNGIGSMGMWKREASIGAAGENSFVSIIGQIGIVGFIFLAGAYFNIFINLMKNKIFYLKYALSIFIIALLFNSMFSPVMMSVTPLILFWFFIGYSESLDMNAQRQCP